MKINLYGNICNTLYDISKILRNIEIDMNLFVDIEGDIQTKPESEDSNLIGNYPHWIKTNKKFSSLDYVIEMKNRDFISELSDCDIIHCSGLAPIFALRTKKPYIFHATGWDMNVIPFKKFPNKHFLLSKLQREAIVAAEYIIAAGGYFHNSIERLGIAKKVIRIPLLIDVEKFKPFSSIKIEAIKKKLELSGIDFVFFHPSRHMWQSLQREDLTKGNDKLIKAYAQFAKKNKDVSSRLICIDAGVDVEESKKLITKLGIQDNIIWIPHQIREELIKYYAISDIVFDFFGYGTYGVVTMEAMAMGKPVFVHLDNNIDELMGLNSVPPITNVNTEEEIFQCISENTIDKLKLENQGQISREWILENHYSKPIEKYLNLYKKILG